MSPNLLKLLADVLVCRCLLSNCTLLHCSDCQRGECQSTICPMHVCSACGAISSRDQPLIECRHCSTSYHEACLPETLKSNGSTRISLDDLRMVCTRHNSEEATEVQLFAEDVLELWRQSMARKLPDVFKAQLPTKVAHIKVTTASYHTMDCIMCYVWLGT